jgi:hypothetical protein
MKRLDPTDLKPCSHMRTLVSARVDNKLSGLAGWYTDHHIKGCAQCQASIPFLTSLKERLLELESDGSDDRLQATRMESIEQNLQKIDAGDEGTA